MRTLVASMLLFGSALGAADLGGTWMQEQAGRGGGQPRRSYYYFKVDGNTFTGQMVSTNDRREITNGKIDGNTITFDSKNSFQENAQQMRGELNGDDLTITVVGGGRGRGGFGGPGGPPPGGAPGRGPGASGAQGAAAGRGPGGGRGNFTPPVFHKIAADMKITAELLPT